MPQKSTNYQTLRFVPNHALWAVKHRATGIDLLTPAKRTATATRLAPTADARPKSISEYPMNRHEPFRKTRRELLCAQAKSFLAPPRCVYVMEGEDVVKVGMSKNTAARRTKLARGRPLRVVYETDQTNRAEEIEALALNLLAPHGVGGEWFKVSADAAIQAVKGAYHTITSGQRDPEEFAAAVI